MSALLSGRPCCSKTPAPAERTIKAGQSFWGATEHRACASQLLAPATYYRRSAAQHIHSCFLSGAHRLIRLSNCLNKIPSLSALVVSNSASPPRVNFEDMAPAAPLDGAPVGTAAPPAAPAALPPAKRLRGEADGPRDLNAEMQKRGEIHEYTSMANPSLPLIPVVAHDPELHTAGPSRIETFDLSKHLKIPYAATSPNLLAAFIRVCTGESVESQATATSQAFYVIRGEGSSESEYGITRWSEGDLFVLPTTSQKVTHKATGGEHGGAALYWVSDEPLMRYLGVVPHDRKFEPTMWTKEALLERVEEIRHTAGATELNRCGVLLGNEACDQTKTLTHVLWSLLNSLAPNSVQRPHRHNSVALDLAVSAAPNVYTLMSPSLDAEGNLVNPVRVDWVTGGVFVTPPGWWHSHHNESDTMAWVLPMQDAGLYTHQRTLDIRFVDEEIKNVQKGMVWGSSFSLKRKDRLEQYHDIRESPHAPEADNIK